MMLMDIVFDNIVTDMIVRQKIVKALKASDLNTGDRLGTGRFF
jgi:hypothetical protein